MRILIAGSTGVVGSRLLPMLVADGHQVTALTRKPERAAALRTAGADPVVADVLDAPAVATALRAAAPEVVMHQLTDLSNIDHAANATLRTAGTRNLMDAALAAGVQRVIAQSIAWAYEPGTGPATEATPLDLRSSDARLRTVQAVDALERAVREAPEWVVLRYGMFDDAARAAAAALSWPSGAVNVCDDEPAAGSNWLPAFCAAVGAPPPPVDETTPRAGWARGAANRRAREELGWAPRHSSWRTQFAELLAGGAED
jgi:nucleoside-diphosphate-sugar epimerase